MHPSRNVITFLIACIAFVGIAAALKMNQMPSGHLSRPDFGITPASQKPPVTDQSFLASTTGAGASGSSSASTATSTGASVISVAKVAPPSDVVTADAYVVGDVSTSKIYLEKNPQLVLPFASMSKIITAITATDMYASSTPMTVTELETEVPPDASALKAGETFTLHDLLYPMLLNSSNVAAEVVASSSDRQNFLEQMSSYAWEIGMPNSYFADPTGLSPRNAGTAIGFFAMAQYLYTQRPDILAITRTPSLSVPTTTDHGAHTFTSIHPFVNDPRFIGGKTGHTPEALDTMLTILNIKNHPIAIVILHSSQGRQKDTQILIDKVTKAL